MASEPTQSALDAPTLRRAAGGIGLFVAIVHLFHPTLGFPRLLEYVRLGTLYDPRPLAFTLSGAAIVAGVLLAYNGVWRKPLYVGGIVLMIAYIGGYAAWHTVLDHGGFWPHIEAHGHHDVGNLEVILDHLLNDAWAMVSKLTEAALLVLLVALLAIDEES